MAADGKLSLTVVTPGGVMLDESDIDGVVVRRKEPDPLGSELLIRPLHSPMLARVQPCTMRYYKAGETRFVDVDGGFMEVKGDHVTLVTTGSLVPSDRAR